MSPAEIFREFFDRYVSQSRRPIHLLLRDGSRRTGTVVTVRGGLPIVAVWLRTAEGEEALLVSDIEAVQFGPPRCGSPAPRARDKARATATFPSRARRPHIAMSRLASAGAVAP
jgi:hypothetical protein